MPPFGDELTVLVGVSLKPPKQHGEGHLPAKVQLVRVCHAWS